MLHTDPCKGSEKIIFVAIFAFINGLKVCRKIKKPVHAYVCMGSFVEAELKVYPLS
jgi:hypothetical protein